MVSKEILKQNKESWEIVAPHFTGVDALPNYGPFAQSEEELHLFEDLQGKKVLEIGYGSGHSLRYMNAKGASELWGVDLSNTQNEAATLLLQGLNPHLFRGAMETDIGLPREYFDYVYSVYAIGWTTDLQATFDLIYSYLKKGGIFIFSWDHPLYAHMTSENGRLLLEGSYQEEGVKVMENFKGEEVDMMIYKRKMSTYLNQLIQSGFLIGEVIESEPGQNYDGIEAEVSDRYYSLYKARKFPATMIIKAGKR
ncbi:Methyltransferase domain-containing protein [Halobacillus alkaliphilus]|uniref:Methyltransferase domain-containing protein n=1 Tax=Halobacillus alkaliphilus TaxID=396056 RepID=A0A1I2SPJ6_9BACI|nr:class I SAM-dependent methyltransferase [Halobacillus alkaliphilus]SFG54718.1 Methyltransferase domain-containing protein [Halobacillus alkaliphilus]